MLCRGSRLGPEDLVWFPEENLTPENPPDCLAEGWAHQVEELWIDLFLHMEIAKDVKMLG